MATSKSMRDWFGSNHVSSFSALLLSLPAIHLPFFLTFLILLFFFFFSFSSSLFSLLSFSLFLSLYHKMILMTTISSLLSPCDSARKKDEDERNSNTNRERENQREGGRQSQKVRRIHTRTNSLRFLSFFAPSFFLCPSSFFLFSLFTSSFLFSISLPYSRTFFLPP